MRKQQILPKPNTGNGKTHYLRESNIRQAKNMSYLYNLEGKSISNLKWNAEIYFILKNDATDNEKSENKIFDILTKNSKNKMACLKQIQDLIRTERVKRKKAELELKELKRKKKNA